LLKAIRVIQQNQLQLFVLEGTLSAVVCTTTLLKEIYLQLMIICYNV